MEENLKKLLYTGAGALVISGKKFRELVEEVVQNNQYTQDEGRRVIHQVINKAEDAYYGAEKSLRSALDNLLMSLNMPESRELRLKLEDLIAELRNKGFQNKIHGDETSLMK